MTESCENKGLSLNVDAGQRTVPPYSIEVNIPLVSDAA